MYMRFVQIKVQPDKMAAFEEFYHRRVAAALRDTGGCLFACLMNSNEHPSECVSMSLWRDPKDVEQYETGGLYTQLLEESEPFFWNSTEWRVKLSDDMRLEYVPVKEEPVAEAFSIATDSDEGRGIESASSNMYLRILSGQVKPGRFDDLSEAYTKLIPEILAVDGCRYASLIRGNDDENEVLSVTLWDSKAQADEYHNHGRFREFASRIQPFMSSVLQWTMTLSDSARAREAISTDAIIEGYQVVMGDSFNRAGP